MPTEAHKKFEYQLMYLVFRKKGGKDSLTIIGANIGFIKESFPLSI